MEYQSSSTTADAAQRPRLNRSRWAAIGAAVAVSLGAGGFGLASATVSTGEKPVYIAISPCRLTDTRPVFLVGPRATPYGPNETVTWTGTGAQGNCNVPAGVSSLVLNVTAIDATLPTFLQFAPGTTVTPGGASSLNPVPGEPPTPNAVTIPIDDDGKFSVYNLQGTVDVIIDVVGYYDDHNHDDRYYTEAEVNSRIAGNRPKADFVGGTHGFLFNVTDVPKAIRTVEMTTTTRGRFIATAEVLATWIGAGQQQLTCSITLNGTATNTTNSMFVDTFQTETHQVSLSAQLGGVAAGDHDINLTCFNDDGPTTIFPTRSALSVQWIPEPLNFIIPPIELPILPIINLEEGAAEGDA